MSSSTRTPLRSIQTPVAQNHSRSFTSSGKENQIQVVPNQVVVEKESSIFAKFDKPRRGVTDAEQQWHRQNGDLARNITRLTKHIQLVQNDNNLLRHRITGSENVARARQMQMAEDEAALTEAENIRQTLMSALERLRSIELTLNKED
uniref:Uncharacterized protein n=1 Tax=Spongospora subterranea TaxID=70186 RepID=A0A0H5RBJ5_9EUKA|eukprot:CRZ11590.1 hypothetical protein [Spongospora subterranea]